jgi:hypothetical protein
VPLILADVQLPVPGRIITETEALRRRQIHTVDAGTSNLQNQQTLMSSRQQMVSNQVELGSGDQLVHRGSAEGGIQANDGTST